MVFFPPQTFGLDSALPFGIGQLVISSAIGEILVHRTHTVHLFVYTLLFVMYFHR